MAQRLELNDVGVQQAVTALARRVRDVAPGPADQWVLVGVQRRGVPLAHRLAAALGEGGVGGVPVGSLDITFYRDDAAQSPLDPVVRETDIPFDITGRVVILVDDVLYTGRTIRCALDELMDFGRPARVVLAVLADRGHRELPIQADATGVVLATTREERVDVHLTEVDGEDAVRVSAP